MDEALVKPTRAARLRRFPPLQFEPRRELARSSLRYTSTLLHIRTFRRTSHANRAHARVGRHRNPAAFLLTV